MSRDAPSPQTSAAAPIRRAADASATLTAASSECMAFEEVGLATGEQVCVPSVCGLFLECIRKIIASLAVLVAFSMPLPVCAMDKVVLQLRWDHQFQFAGYYAAQLNKYYEEAGLDVEVRSAIAKDGRVLRAVDEVSSGRAQFGVGAADILVANDAGKPLMVSAVIFQQSAAAFYAKKGALLSSPKDFVHLKVARNVNDLIDVELQAMVRAEGIDPKSIKAYPHQPGIDHLVSGAVDVVPGYSMSLPFDLERAGIAYTHIDPAFYGVDFYGDSLFVSAQLARENPELVMKFTEASLKGWRYALQHSEEIALKIADNFPRHVTGTPAVEFNKFQVAGVKRLSHYPIVDLGHVNPGRWAAMHSALKTSGLVRATFDPEAFVFDPARDQLASDAKARRWLLLAVVLLSGTGLIAFGFIRVLRSQVVARTGELSNEIAEHKQATSVARYNEDRYRQLFEKSMDAILQTAPDGIILAANPAACALFALTEKEIIDRGRPGLVDTSDPRLAKLLQVRSETGIATGELRMRRGDESLFDAEISSSIYLNSHGYSVSIMMIRDITERKQAEVHEQHLQSVLRMLTDGVVLDIILERIVRDVEALNPDMLCSILLLYEDGKHLRHGAAPSLPDFYNQGIDGVAIGPTVGSCGAAAFTGKTVIVADIQTHSYWTPYRDLASRAGLASCWSQPILSGEGEVQGSFAIYHRQPSTPTAADLKSIEDYAVLASLAITKSADSEKLQLTIAALSAAKEEAEVINQQLEARNVLLEESEVHLAGVIESADDAIISIDSRHRIVVFNPAAQKIFGHAEAAMLGQTLDALIPQRFRAQHIDHVQSFVTEDSNSRRAGGARQLVGMRSDGIEFPIEASISRFRCKGEWHSTVILRDITQRNAAETALVQSRQELTRSNADLEQFAYAASHDLQEPLRSVASSVQLLQKRYEGKLDARADTFIAHAVSGATRMQALIDDLLAFSRIGNKSNQATDISMESALSAAIANLQQAIVDSNAQITHDALPSVQAQSGQMTQLLQNLLANAIKFRGVKPATVHVGARQAGREWVFSVADQGIGIEPKYFNRIFELFKRLHTREEYAGTGIGLALCKKIVERHGGRIWVESEPGRGTTFFFAWPN